MLARPKVRAYEYTFAGSITLVFASGVGLCLGQPQLPGERRFERPRRGTEDLGRAARARNGGTGGRLRRPGQGEARGVRPSTLSSLAVRLNDGQLRDGDVYELGRRRFRVALLSTETPASRDPGLRLNPQLRQIPAEIRAGLTSAEIAMSGSISMTCCAIAGATASRTPPTKYAGRALFETPYAPSVLSATRTKVRVAPRPPAAATGGKLRYSSLRQLCTSSAYSAHSGGNQRLQRDLTGAPTAEGISRQAATTLAATSRLIVPYPQSPTYLLGAAEHLCTFLFFVISCRDAPCLAAESALVVPIPG